MATVRMVLVVCLLGACSADMEQLQTFVIDEQTFTLGDAITVGPGSAAIMNVVDDACDAFLGAATPGHFDGEQPLLLGAFADGPFGVANVDGDDPRMYVTAHDADDFVDIYDYNGVGRLEMHLTFDRVLRQVRKGIDVYVDVEELEVPVVVEGAVAVRPCVAL